MYCKIPQNLVYLSRSFIISPKRVYFCLNFRLRGKHRWAYAKVLVGSGPTAEYSAWLRLEWLEPCTLNP